MGRPKALLPFDDQPLIAHVVAALRTLCADIVVVGAPEQDLPRLPATVIRDEVAYQGPVGGMRHGLAAISGDVAIVVGCDTPFVSLPLVGHLFGLISGFDAVVPTWQGHLQPLNAVYRKTVLPTLQRQFERGDLTLVDLFDEIRTLHVDEDEVRRLDPDGASFFNMNTPDDYANALERWNAMRSDGLRRAAAPLPPTMPT
jgi:molybdopterin-guanine dinucleotide biosynthesis protein A